jgi:uncharacterized membrane protein
MEDTENRWSDQRVETMIGNVLRAGVLLAAAVVALGGIVFLVRHGSEIPHYRTFVGQPDEYRVIPLILARAATFHGRNIVQLGLLLLIATPVARVALSVVAFALKRDRMYVVFTLIVLAVLVFSLAGGHL